MNTLAYRLLGSNPDRATSFQRTTHTYVVGQPGTGKSRAIESWVVQDIEAGEGVCVIDPHGDLYYNLVSRLALRPELWSRIVLLDPCDTKWAVSFNPLAPIKGVPSERLALFLTDVIMKIWGIEVASAPRLLWLLTNTFLALTDLKLTLLDLPRFLQDSQWRQYLLTRLSNDTTRTYFTHEFPKTAAGIQQWITPVLNKIGSLIFDPDTRLLLAGRTSLNFRDLLDRKLILLVNLPKGRIGEGASALFGAFIVAHLQKAALARADSRHRTPFYLYLDEFQNYTTDNITDILSESRKYALSLTLAHQYIDQLQPHLRSAVLNTAGTLACFRVSHHDAARLVKEIFPTADFLTRSKRKVKLRRFWPLLLPTIEEHDEALRWDGLSQVLTNLRLREFWVKRRGVSVPVKLRTLDVPDVAMTPELREQAGNLRDASGARYGRLKATIRRELAANRYDVFTSFEGFTSARTEPHHGRDDIPLWGN